MIAACLVLATACGDDDAPPQEDTGSTGNGTTNGPTTNDDTNGNPTTDDPTTGNPATGTTTDDPGTTGATEGTTGDTGEETEGTSSGGEGSTSSGGEESTSSGGEESTSSGGMMGDCAMGDGPVFNITNAGAGDYVIDGINDPALVVVRGCSYTFNVNAPGHPFWINSVQGTGVGNAYNDGVTNNGAATGVITWDVPMGAPDDLFYNCQFHAPMTSTITVIGP